jgi:hypothetical protein
MTEFVGSIIVVVELFVPPVVVFGADMMVVEVVGSFPSDALECTIHLKVLIV